MVEAPGRKITGYIWTNHQAANGDPIIVDVPTTMASLLYNVDARLGKGSMKDSNSADYRALEDNEIGQFVRYLTIFRNQDEIEDQLVRDNYRIINLSDSFEPNLLG